MIMFRTIPPCIQYNTRSSSQNHRLLLLGTIPNAHHRVHPGVEPTNSSFFFTVPSAVLSSCLRVCACLVVATRNRVEPFPSQAKWMMGVETMDYTLSGKSHFHRTVWFKCVVMAAVAATTLRFLTFLDKTSPTAKTSTSLGTVASSFRNHSGVGGAQSPDAQEEEPQQHRPSHLPLTTNRHLRFDWSNLSLTTPLGRAMLTHQSDCSLPLGDLRMRNTAGLGSDLHLWTQALCNGMQHKVRVQTLLPWIFRDTGACNNQSQATAMLCYFPDSELRCPDDEADLRAKSNRTQLYVGIGMVKKECKDIRTRYNASFSDVRASGIEYLFSHTGSVVIQEAESQLKEVFGDNVPLPSQLITVHIRWGDKKAEMELLPIEKYIAAVQTLASTKNLTGSKVHIFLASEDPLAVQRFQKAAKVHQWKVFVDAYFQDFSDVPHQGYGGNTKMSKSLQGQPGLVALASLLVALQANNFVLTTQSNWSRLINELRKNILDPRCDSCSQLIDLTKTLREW